MDLSELESRILTHVQQTNYRPVKPRVIAKQLDVPTDQWDGVRRAIKRLVHQGHLAYGDRHLVFPAAGNTPASAGKEQGAAGPKRTKGSEESASLVVGVYRRTGGGRGYVRLLNG